MVRKLSLTLVLCASVVSSGVSALGLGQIHPQSTLNQNFRADIDLLSVKADELPDVKVSLASADAFAKAGIDRPFALTKLRFRPEVRSDGSAVIRVSSREPIREPFLDFLIEVNWPNGKLLREFVVLLDPPVTMQRPPAPVAAPAVRPPRPQVQAPKATPTDTGAGFAGGAAAQTVAADSSEYGPTKEQDTLWSIADRLRPEGVSVQQMMLALLRANPDAFYDNNVNSLLAGQILRIPERDALLALSAEEAQTEFLSQMRVWQERAPLAVAGSSTEVGSADSPAEAGDRLRLTRVNLDEESAAAEGKGGVNVAQLQQDLLLAHEEAESAKQESADLRARIAQLEQQLVTAGDRLVSVQSDELAQMQAAQRTDEEAAPMDEVVTEAEPVIEEAASAEETVAEVAEPVAAPPPAMKETPKVESAPELLTPARAEPEGFLDAFLGNPIWLGSAAGGVFVMAVVVWLLLRRRGGDSGEQESILAPASARTSDLDTAAAGVISMDSQETEETSFLSDFAPSEISAIAEDAGEVDAISEADVYIAYGRYPQAEDLLLEAIEKAPQRLDIKHKLLEVHHAIKNAESFVAVAQELHEAGGDQDEAAWDRVVSMGRELAPEHPLFSGAGAAAEGDSGEDEPPDLDLGEFAMDTENTVEVTAPAVDEEQDMDFDFELPEELSAPDSVVEAEAMSEAGLANLEGDNVAADGGDRAIPDLEDLDFDFSTDEEAAPEAESPEAQVGEPRDAASAEDDLDLGLGDLELSLADEMPGSSPPVESVEEAPEDELKVDFGDLPDLTLEMADDADEVDSPTSEGLSLEGESSEEEVDTKLDLAKAYADMGDAEGASNILDEVLAEGSDTQKATAEQLKQQLSG